METTRLIAVFLALPAAALLSGCEPPPSPQRPAIEPAMAVGSISASLERLGVALRPGPQGLMIVAMDLDGPAAEAGAQVGDVLVAVNGTAVKDGSGLDRMLAATSAPQALQLDLKRKGQPKQVSVSLGGPGKAMDAAWNPLGLQVKELPEAARKALGVSFGVMVTKVRAPADRTRILPGDVIVGIDQARISSLDEFNRLLEERKSATVGLLVRRADSYLYFPFEAAGEALERPRPRPATETPLRT